MATYRHLARIAVMQTLFSIEFKKSKKTPKEILHYNIAEISKHKIDDKFAEDLLTGVLKQKDKLKETISENAPEWPFEKIAPIDRAILEIGTFELIYNEDVPQIVAIDEAIEIAKEYGDENSSKFVNGVLNSIMNKNPREKSGSNKPK